jgi:hypothetical protein
MGKTGTEARGVQLLLHFFHIGVREALLEELELERHILAFS